jgi:general secretion pathway protein N
MARSFRPSRSGSRSLGPVQSGYAAWAWAGSLLGALGTLAVYAPAAWLAAGVAQASAGQVQLADARGTVWNGSAQLVLTGGAQSSDASALPERVQWTLRPALAGLRGHILPTCCSDQPTAVRLTAHWGGARLDLSTLQVKLPAELLSGLGTPWNTIHPQGQLALSAPAVSLDWVEGRAQLDGSATLDMTDISSRLSTLRPLGDYRLSLTGGAVPSLQLQTLQGALQLSGSGQWVGARMRFSGEASAAPEREAALSNLLNIIGRRQGAKSLISLG